MRRATDVQCFVIGFGQGAANHLGVGQRLFNVAHGSPIELLLLLVLELPFRENGDGFQNDMVGRIARLGNIGKRVDYILRLYRQLLSPEPDNRCDREGQQQQYSTRYGNWGFFTTGG